MTMDPSKPNPEADGNDPQPEPPVSDHRPTPQPTAEPRMWSGFGRAPASELTENVEDDPETTAARRDLDRAWPPKPTGKGVQPYHERPVIYGSGGYGETPYPGRLATCD